MIDFFFFLSGKEIAITYLITYLYPTLYFVQTFEFSDDLKPKLNKNQIIFLEGRKFGV